MEHNVWQAYKAKGVQVLGLAVAERDAGAGIDPVAKLKEFRARHNLTYPLLSDEDQTVFNRFGGGSIPSCVLVDWQGRLVAKIDDGVEAIADQVGKLVDAR